MSEYSKAMSDAMDQTVKECQEKGYLTEYLGRNEFLDIAMREFTINNYIELATEEAAEQAAKEERIQFIRGLYKNGVPIKIIAASRDISEEEVKAILNL